jgi:hypothetical protein
MSARTGGLVSLAYGWETAFTSGSASVAKVFGRGQRVTNATRRENPENIYELGSRTINSVVYKQFEGTLSLEWILSNPWFFKAFMGVATTTSGAPVSTHVFTKTSGVLPSIETDVGFAASSGAITRKMMGMVMGSVTLTASINDVIRVRGEFPYYREPAISMAFAAPSVDTFAPLTFCNASLIIGGNTIAEVQSFELTLNNNPQPVFGIGSCNAQGAIPTQFDAVGRMAVTMKDASFLGMLRSEVTSGSLYITNGLTSNSLVTIAVSLNGLNFGEHTVSYQPNQIIVENLPITVRDILDITSQNNTTAVP